MVKLLVVLVLVAVAYVAGYWPERGRRQAAEQEAQSLRARAEDAEGRARLSSLLGEALSLEEAVARQNYGDAQQLASAFFDHVRAELTAPIPKSARLLDRAATPAFKGPLQTVLQQRDGVTAALTRADPTVIEPLRHARALLRTALGYRVYGGGAAMAPPALAPPAAAASPLLPSPIEPSPLAGSPPP